MMNLDKSVNFDFLCNDNISQKYLWKDGIHFDDKGRNVSAENLQTF